jgi:hypothetical protein
LRKRKFCQNSQSEARISETDLQSYESTAHMYQ